jgi:hypothetical protein
METPALSLRLGQTPAQEAKWAAEAERRGCGTDFGEDLFRGGAKTGSGQV